MCNIIIELLNTEIFLNQCFDLKMQCHSARQIIVEPLKCSSLLHPKAISSQSEAG